MSEVTTEPRLTSLASFNGLDPNGSWTLALQDVSFGGQSQVMGWGLQITAVPGDTLEALTDRAARAFPALAEPLAELVALHSEQRYAPGGWSGQRRRRARQRWQLALRQVKGQRINAISRGCGSNR